MSESSVAGKMAENRRFFGHKLRGYLMSESSGRQERRRGKKDRCPLIARKVAENRGFPLPCPIPVSNVRILDQVAKGRKTLGFPAFHAPGI
jgi:hypothetical protein